MRVALFIPCLIDQFFPEVKTAVEKVLRRFVTVEIPAEQTCCGQPAFNTGYWDEARPLAHRYREIFTGYDAVVCPSGSCTAMVRNYYPALGVTPPATFEFAEFLVKKLGVTDLGAKFPAKVTYHDGCHALRELRLKDEPRQLLRHVRGLELIEMPDAETCCGFGGTFSVKYPAISQAMSETKRSEHIVVSTDSSCLMHIARTGTKTMHLAQILAST
jgi:L-lactate dehydrogenase complex protein LldE